MAAKKTAKTEKAPAAANNIQEEKLKALEHALADLDKQFGKGAVMKMGSDAVNRDIPVISTGCLTLDYALGVGGIPRGRIVEISSSCGQYEQDKDWYEMDHLADGTKAHHYMFLG